MSQTLARDALLQTRAQLDLHAVLPLSAVVHQQEVGVVAVQTGEAALALSVHRVMGWKASLRRGRAEAEGERGGEQASGGSQFILAHL